MIIKVREYRQPRGYLFIYGAVFASILWLIFLLVVSTQALRQYRDVESQAYQEVYQLRQHNNLLKPENQNLVNLNSKPRR